MRRGFLYTPPEHYRNVMELLVKKLGFDPVQAITATELRDEIEAMSHLGRGLTVSIRTRIPKSKPVVDSIVEMVSEGFCSKLV